MKNYSFLKTAIIRTPLGKKQIDLTWEIILDIFSNIQNREALFIGSPNLYNTLVKFEKGKEFQNNEDLESLKISLYKYASRLSNRCTPFGLFATVSAINLDSKTSIQTEDFNLSRKTKFDMHFLTNLITSLEKDLQIRKALKFKINSTLYKVGNKYRYVEFYYKNSVRFHKISEVEFSNYLDLIIEQATHFILPNELAQFLVSEDISFQDAHEFINTLIDNQFLVSELEFTLTGEDYFEKIIKLFSEERFNFHEGKITKDLLNNLRNRINYLDENISNDPELYNSIFLSIKKEFNGVDIAKLFQIDTYRDVKNSTLSYSTLKNIRPAITVLNKLSSFYQNNLLQEFKSKFRERFEEYEQPLVNVLDPDIGIGYGNQSGAKSPLVDDLKLSSRGQNNYQITLDQKKNFLLKKLIQSTKENTTNIELNDNEINSLEEDLNLYPETFSVFLNAFNENEMYHLKSITGPSANALIGRFSHLNDTILNLCNEIATTENQLNENKILAEIIHTPQARTGNILFRKFNRNYEIPYLGNSSLAKENQISVNDLYISLDKRNNIILRSKRLNKQIIPRLGNAHNYSSNALPIYQFLCDVQNESCNSFSFNWGPLQYNFEYLPRVTYKNVVLSKATWNINKQEIDYLLSFNIKNCVEAIQKFVNQRNIPKVVNFTKGDKEILINFENDLSCKVFYSMLKKNNLVQLTEFLFSEKSITNDYCNEIILTAHKNIENNTNQKQVSQKQYNTDKIEKQYSIGDKWLYYKFYCGEKSSEEILNNSITPIITKLKKEGSIEKWFFIRYKDHLGYHIRFRLLLKQMDQLDNCISSIKKYTKKEEKLNLIWKIQTDTYIRELDRYGYKTIEEAEALFYNDSECTLNFLNLIEGDQGEKIRWLFSLVSMDRLLDDLGFNLETKIEILKVAKINFGTEFNRNGLLNKQINDLYKENEHTIDDFLALEKENELFNPIWKLIEKRSKNNKVACESLIKKFKTDKLPGSLQSLSLSYLHMICNRVFITKQRIHEMVVYDFLYKYYAKKLHKKTNPKEVNTYS